jgi:hypothetical protein
MRASTSLGVICFVVLAAAHLLARAAGFSAVLCRRPPAMGGSGTGCPLALAVCACIVLSGRPSRTARIFCSTVIHVPHQHEQRA